MGTHFGFEEALLERYGVGRALFREAIRVVEQHQVAKMRRGPRGGLIVTAPDASAVADAMAVYLRYSGTTVRQLMEVRALIEPLAAEAAASHITEKGIVRIRGIVDTAASGEQLREGFFDPLHSGIAELSGNYALALFLDVVNSLLNQIVLSRVTDDRLDLEALRDVHMDLAAAVMGGDAAKAGELARSHVHHLIDLQDETMQQWAAPAELEEVDATLPHAYIGDSTLAGEPGPKMAAVLATRIEAEIARRGWPIGERIGFEPELITRYGISRAVCREAVRILEHLGIAQMKMGPTGGLVVTRPDPGAASQAMALLLEFHGVDAAQVQELRTAFELRSLDMIMTGGSTDKDVASLRKATPDSPLDEDPGQGMCDGLHLRMAELTENPAFQVFTSSILSLWRFRALNVNTPGSSSTAPASAESIVEDHRDIVDAIADNDRPIARRRSIGHLDRISSVLH